MRNLGRRGRRVRAGVRDSCRLGRFGKLTVRRRRSSFSVGNDACPDESGGSSRPDESGFCSRNVGAGSFAPRRIFFFSKVPSVFSVLMFSSALKADCLVLIFFSWPFLSESWLSQNPWKVDQIHEFTLIAPNRYILKNFSAGIVRGRKKKKVTLE